MTSAVLSSGDLDLSVVDRAVTAHGKGADALIPILQEIQDTYRYLPESAMRRICDLTEITPQALYGVSTFYAQFRHQPVGKHIIRICHGTACHVKGSPLVEDAIRR